MTSGSDETQRLRDLALLRRVRDRMDCEYAQPLDVEALARGEHMSAGHLSRQFRLAYGDSPYAYLMTRRIERATALLRGTDLSVTDICFAVGCSSLGTFSTRFTEFVGVPPSTSRQRTRGATADMPACVARQVTQPGPESRSAGRGRREVPAKLARQVRMLPADHGHKDDEADALSSVSPRSPLHGWTPSPSTRPPPCCGN